MSVASLSSAARDAIAAMVDNPSAQRLVEIGLDEIAARGFHATTTRDISTKSGLSPAAMYVHYSSKEQLLFQIALIGHSAARDRLNDALAGVDHGASCAQRMEVILREFIFWHAEHTTLARVCEYELQHLSAEHSEQIGQIRHEIEATVRAEIQRGVEAGEFSVPDVRFATMALSALAIDIVRWYSPGTGITPAELADNLAALGLKLVTA